MELREPPERLVVLGAGPVGLEIGQLFLHLGSKVTFIARGRVAPREEPEASDALRSVLEEEGADVLAGAQVTELLKDGAVRTVVYSAEGREERVSADHILVATGRQPNTAGLGLEKARIAMTERAGVKVNEILQITNPRVWAAGDVTGHPQYVYLAAHEGSLAARNALQGAGLRLDLRSLPRVIFTSPTFAAAGLTDEEAAQQGLACDYRLMPMSAVPRALVNRDTRGFVKIVAEAGSGRILGATVVPRALGTSSRRRSTRSSSASPRTRWRTPGPRT